jgi:phosphate transport system permease protein
VGRFLTEKRKDRAANLVIRVGGILVILVVIAIVINIGMQALPLFVPARTTAGRSAAVPPGTLLAGLDPRQESLWVLTDDGAIRCGQGETELLPYDAPTTVAAADHEIHGLVSVVSDDGRLAVGRLRFADSWQGGERSTTVRWSPAADLLQLDVSAPWVGVTANSNEDGDLVAAAWRGDGTLELARWDGDDEEWQLLTAPADLAVSSVAIAEELAQLAVTTRSGGLRVFTLPALNELEVENVDAKVTALRYLIGGGTLIVAHGDRAIQVVLTIPRVEVVNRGRQPLTITAVEIPPGESRVLADDQIGLTLASRSDVAVEAAPPTCRAVRHLRRAAGTPLVIAPSHRGRDFLVGADNGAVSLYHSTSGRRLISERWAEAPVRAAALAPKGDGAVILAGSTLDHRHIVNPHPEVSLRTLFLPVWYEGYAAPKWVWQSTGGSDAFEPKLGLWPLIFGTLKATLYALVFSVPLALMAAVYVSQLAPSWLQTVIKPTLELMAAVPSVVVGFLAALWLAPRLEGALLVSLLGIAALPLAVVVALAIWRLVPPRWRRRLPAGGELAVMLLTVAIVLPLVAALAGPLERLLFGGDLQRFLFTEWGVRYDQRNSIVVGLALGFAVIPMIFTIAEDACSSVPRSLVAASRALGATRWQTAVRLVVPAASPGLFAAVMLGLGRAVGETMIVLMAAGNTPLLDLSPFNGMRTMSAAIAVEIPEAPVGGTLFRVLFLTGTLLFVFTLALTTVADLVGARLRARYARF